MFVLSIVDKKNGNITYHRFRTKEALQKTFALYFTKDLMFSRNRDKLRKTLEVIKAISQDFIDNKKSDRLKRLLYNKKDLEFSWFEEKER